MAWLVGACAPAPGKKRLVQVPETGSTSAPVVTVAWEQGADGSDLVLRDGVTYKVLTAEGVTIITAVHDLGKRFRVDVHASNASSERFDLFPQRISFIMVAPQERPLNALPAEKLAKSIKRRAAWAAALAGLGSNATEQVNATTSTTGNVSAYGYSKSGSAHYTETSTTTMTVPDHEARQRASENVRVIHEQASAELAELRDIALQANTLFPGEEVAGSVFFAKDERIRSGIVTVPAGGHAFEFPYAWARRKD